MFFTPTSKRSPMEVQTEVASVFEDPAKVLADTTKVVPRMESGNAVDTLQSVDKRTLFLTQPMSPIFRDSMQRAYLPNWTRPNTEGAIREIVENNGRSNELWMNANQELLNDLVRRGLVNPDSAKASIAADSTTAANRDRERAQQDSLDAVSAVTESVPVDRINRLRPVPDTQWNPELGFWKNLFMHDEYKAMGLSDEEIQQEIARGDNTGLNVLGLNLGKYLGAEEGYEARAKALADGIKSNTLPVDVVKNNKTAVDGLLYRGLITAEDLAKLGVGEFSSVKGMTPGKTLPKTEAVQTVEAVVGQAAEPAPVAQAQPVAQAPIVQPPVTQVQTPAVQQPVAPVAQPQPQQAQTPVASPTLPNTDPSLAGMQDYQNVQTSIGDVVSGNTQQKQNNSIFANSGVQALLAQIGMSLSPEGTFGAQAGKLAMDNATSQAYGKYLGEIISGKDPKELTGLEYAFLTPEQKNAAEQVAMSKDMSKLAKELKQIEVKLGKRELAEPSKIAVKQAENDKEAYDNYVYANFLNELLAGKQPKDLAQYETLISPERRNAAINLSQQDKEKAVEQLTKDVQYKELLKSQLKPNEVQSLQVSIATKMYPEFAKLFTDDQQALYELSDMLNNPIESGLKWQALYAKIPNTPEGKALRDKFNAEFSEVLKVANTGGYAAGAERALKSNTAQQPQQAQQQGSAAPASTAGTNVANVPAKVIRTPGDLRTALKTEANVVKLTTSITVDGITYPAGKYVVFGGKLKPA